MLLNNNEKLVMISNLLRVINDLELDLIKPIYSSRNFYEIWPEIKVILTKTTIIEQISLTQEHQEVLNYEENGELESLKTQINAFLERKPKHYEVDSLKKKIDEIQKMIFIKYMDLL